MHVFSIVAYINKLFFLLIFIAGWAMQMDIFNYFLLPLALPFASRAQPPVGSTVFTDGYSQSISGKHRVSLCVVLCMEKELDRAQGRELAEKRVCVIRRRRRKGKRI